MKLRYEKSQMVLAAYLIFLVGAGLVLFQVTTQKIAYSARPLSQKITALLPNICQQQETTTTNPRPALFIGCGIFE